ncbi:hypothetical protein ACM66B_005982 [Microbotryomycetes sp. NB124-2]
MSADARDQSTNKQLLSDDDGGSTPGVDDSKGKQRASKKNVHASNEELRKEQNRRAQRDFRQRKQQYIKELEAKVALQGTARDEQIDLLGKAIEQLVEENVKLRELLAGVTGFIGEGLGGYLPRIGMELQQFNAIATQTKLDTITSVIDKVLPNARETIARQVASAPGNPTAKRRRATTSATDSPQGTAPVASTSTSEQYPSGPSFADVPNNLFAPALALSGLKSPNAPFSLPPPPTAQYSTASDNSHREQAPSSQPPASLRDIVNPVASTSQPGTGTSTPTARTQEEINDAHTQEVRNVLPTSGARLGTQQMEKHHAAYEQKLQELFNQPTDNPKLQAIQMISYHMRNKREQPNYHLPPSLKATVTQQTVPHSTFFDGIIFPSLRDRLILLKDQYDLQTLLEDLMEALNIHGNDILQPCNWELSEKFLRKYWYVIDAEVLGYTNRWRKERGEVELTMRSIVPDGNKDSSTTTSSSAQQRTYFE